MAATTIKLPAKLDRELTALTKERHTTRAKVLREALHAFAEKKPERERIKKLKGTVAELAGDLVGSVEGPGDLTSNPKYMARYGR
jgi:predicted transcriptional regulator